MVILKEILFKISKKTFTKLTLNYLQHNLQFKKSKFVSKIILATGNSRVIKYFEFSKRLNSFCYNDEEDVTKRIYLLTKLKQNIACYFWGLSSSRL